MIKHSRHKLLLLVQLLGAACSGEPEATLTISVAGIIPADTVSVNLDTQPYDSCYQLPRRYAPSAARQGIVLPRRCFLDEATYVLDAWTYGAGCCTLAKGETSFQGYLDPRSRQTPPSLSVQVALAPVQGAPVCNAQATCDPS